MVFAGRCVCEPPSFRVIQVIIGVLDLCFNFLGEFRGPIGTAGAATVAIIMAEGKMQSG
jgi:hypothetical protein